MPAIDNWVKPGPHPSSVAPAYIGGRAVGRFGQTHHTPLCRRPAAKRMPHLGTIRPIHLHGDEIASKLGSIEEAVLRILVAAASKHGATAEIATHVGKVFQGAGLDCDVQDVGEVSDLSGYEAVVLGSGVYAGQWLKDARKFVDDHAAALQAVRVWLFSSGPLGDPLQPDDEDAVDADGLVAATGAQDHRLFAGALDKSKLGFGERAIVKAVRAPDGDFRDWASIEAWAREIVAALQ